MPPLFDDLTDQVLLLGSFDNAHPSTLARADAVSSDAENLRRGHAMGVLDAQASGTDQAYHPSFDTYARSPPAGGGYSNVSEGGIDPYSESSYKRAVSQMHEDMKALIAHGPQFGIDADPIRATYAYRDQIERAFSERSTIPAFHVTHQFNEDAKNLGGVAPSASMFCPDIDPKASPSSDVPVRDSKSCLSQPSRASDIGNASNSSHEGEERQAPDAGPEFPRAQTIQMLADAMRPIRRVFGKSLNLTTCYLTILPRWPKIMVRGRSTVMCLRL